MSSKPGILQAWKRGELGWPGRIKNGFCEAAKAATEDSHSRLSCAPRSEPSSLDLGFDSHRLVHRNDGDRKRRPGIVRQEERAATALVATEHGIIVVRQEQHQMRIDQPVAQM